ncbi:MAG TPA: NAD(P)-binding domain-containing protein [Terriglobales bacterium]|nr:NAD(P)-binding domain-containing protein [Terriglobales bacterium]
MRVPQNHMRIGILGSGLMGSKLGTILARAGHDVIFSYSRNRQKLERLAKDTGVRAHVGTPAGATQDADAVLLAVRWTRVEEDVLAQVGPLSGKPLLTRSLPMSKDDTHMVIGHTTSGAEGLRLRRPEHMWYPPSVSEVLFPVFERREKGSPPDLVYCGDDEGAKSTAARLIRDVGFNPVDLGPLSTARYIEPFSLLVAQRAYNSSDGPAIAYRFERFRKRAK